MKASKKTVLKALLKKEGVSLREFRRVRAMHRNRTYGPRAVPKGGLMASSPWTNPASYGRRPLERKGRKVRRFFDDREG